MGKRRRTNFNRHHLLFQKAYWSKRAYGRALRDNFVYLMEVEKHDKLHEMLHDIPIPSAEELERIWCVYSSQKDYVDTLNAREACLWLAEASNFEPFCAVMRYQATLL